MSIDLLGFAPLLKAVTWADETTWFVCEDTTLSLFAWGLGSDGMDEAVVSCTWEEVTAPRGGLKGLSFKLTKEINTP